MDLDRKKTLCGSQTLVAVSSLAGVLLMLLLEVLVLYMQMPYVLLAYAVVVYAGPVHTDAACYLDVCCCWL